MIPKKTPKADLQKKRLLFFEIGMSVALFSMIIVFSASQKETQLPLAIIEGNTSESVPVIMPVRIPQSSSAPAAAPRQTSISDILNLVREHNPTITEDPFDWDDDANPLIAANFRGNTTGGTTEYGDPDGEIYLQVTKMPRFQGGDINNFRQWLARKVSYPSEAKKWGLTGIVYVSFVVETDGSISNIEILDTPHSSFSEEVVRVIRSSPAWEPGMQQTHKARVKFTLPVDFTMTAF